MKREALNHTKMKRLCRRLNVPLYQAVGILETLWHLTIKQATRGDIGRLSDEDIAIGIDYRGDEIILVESLVHAGWLDKDPTYRLLVHDWPDHADDSVHMKLARSKQTFANGTPPKTNRLAGWERSQADEFFGTSSSIRAHDVRTESENVRTESENVRTACTPPLPQPLPRPSPAPPETLKKEPPPPTPPPPNSGNGNGKERRRQYPELPRTRAAIGVNFADVRDGFLHRLYLRSCAAARKGGGNPDLVTDALLALTVEQCTKKYQESAGLYLDTVPSTIQTWAENEREKGA